MDEDFLLERAVDDDGAEGRKKTRFELDLEKYGSIDAVRTAKTDTDDEPEAVSMARRQGGSKAVNAALSQYSNSFDGQTDPEEDFDDDFSKYILSAHDPIAPVKSYNNEPQAPKAEEKIFDGGGDDDISGFSFDDNESSENEAWAGKSKQKGADFSALAQEVFDEEALIALGKSIKFGKDNQEPEPSGKEDSTYDSDEEFSPEGIVNTLSDRFAPFEFEPAPQPEVVVYEKNELKPKQESEPEPKREPEPEIKSEPELEIKPEIESNPEPQTEPEKKPIFTAAAFAGLAEAVAAAEAAEAAGAGAEAVSTSDDMDATPSVEVDDNTVFPAEPPIGYKKPTPKTAREIAQERIAAGTARTATADEIKAEPETKQATPTVPKPVAQAATATTTQAASTSPTQTAQPATAPKAPPKEIVSLRDLSTGFNDAEYEKQTGTLPVLGELTDEFTGGKRISGKTTRTDDQIQLMRKQEALAMNILSEDSSNAGTVRAERIIYDLHEKNEKKSRLIGRILLISGNALLFVVAIVGMIFYQGDNSGLAFLFRVTIGIGAVGFIPVKFLQKLISPFMILLSLLYVLLGLAGQDPVAANITFYTVGVVAGLFGFTIRFFVPAVKNLFERRKP